MYMILKTSSQKDFINVSINSKFPLNIFIVFFLANKKLVLKKHLT